MISYEPKIFISSTIKDMPSERRAALDAITQIGAYPIMSDFTINAQSTDSVTTCLKKVKDSNLYILILGAKYGWRPDDKISITELEFNTAQKNNIPVLVFNMSFPKEPLQEDFSKRVGALYFWKGVSDAFQLKDAIVESVKEEMNKWEKDGKQNKEPIYANLLKISFPSKLYIADLNLDRKDIIQNSWNSEKHLKNDASWFDVAFSALHQKGIIFPHDWIIHKNQLITFHDLTDNSIPINQILDIGTITPLTCDEYYEQSEDLLNVFKSLLRSCLKTKLYKLGIKWYPKEKLFAFMPTSKYTNGKWKNRKIYWERKSKVSRTVVKINYGIKDPNKLSSSRHLAFEAKFYFMDKNWYVSIKPDWLITWGDFIPSNYGFEKIQYLKRRERNIHVFNHLNFILWYLQPDDTINLFDEYKEYPYLTIDEFVTLNAWPIINDELWRKLESNVNKKALLDKLDKIDLFQ